VREWPVANSDMGKFGKRYYWIEKDDKMKGHVGHTIQLIGKITDVTKSEIEFKAGESGNGFNVEIEGPGQGRRHTGGKRRGEPGQPPEHERHPDYPAEVSRSTKSR
jgi:hypothetical protein